MVTSPPPIFMATGCWTESTSSAPEKAQSIEVHVSNRIKLARMLAGATQAQLASMLGVTYQQISLIERGQGRMYASQLYEIARALNTTVGFLFEELPGVKEGARSTSTLSAELAMQDDGRARHELRTIIKTYHKLSSSDRKAILNWMVTLADDPEAELHLAGDS